MNIQEVCRTCLHSGRPMFPLFGPNAAGDLESPRFNVIELLKFFTDIHISYDDSYPNQLCSECIDEIQQIYSFKLKCKRTDTLLMQLRDVKIRLKKLRDVRIPSEYENDHKNYALNIEKLKKEKNVSNKIEGRERQLQATVPDGKSGHSHYISARDTLPDAQDNYVDISQLLLHVKQEPELDINTEDVNYEDQMHTEMFSDSSRRPFECGMFDDHESNIIDSHNDETNAEYDRINEYERSLMNYTSQQFSHMRAKHAEKRDRLTRTPDISDGKDERFVCENCSKIFRSSASRRQHMRTHSVKRPFKCQLCNKDFRTKHHLKCHDIRKHQEDSMSVGIQCEHCTRMFACNADLVRHLQTHTGEKPFKCQLCPEEYRYKRYFITHMVNVHGFAEQDLNVRKKREIHRPKSFDTTYATISSKRKK